MIKIKLPFDNNQLLQNLVGPSDRNLLIIKQYFNYDITLNRNEIIIDTKIEQKPFFEKVFKVLAKLIDLGVSINERDIIYIINLVEINDYDDIIALYQKPVKVVLSHKGNLIVAKTFNQQKYSIAMQSTSPLVFGVGPAGTGKTFLAVAHAVSELKAGKIKKIILTRPAVEAGENLGFLPGDLKEKVDPYLIPLYDALYDLLGTEQTNLLMEREIIEVAPLAYMRGRTLENAFVILDEAQNTTKAQMKMFLTRLGFNSRMVVNGDPSQIDIKYIKDSGLIDGVRRLNKLKDVVIVNFEKVDVIRHPLVQRVLERYEEDES